jgi:hypothetical protein
MALLAGACGRAQPPSPDAARPIEGLDAAAVAPSCTRRLVDPPRTVVERPCGTFRAVLTDGARSVLLDAPARRFVELSAAHAVQTQVRVRALTSPFTGTLDTALERWLDGALADASPDRLAVAMEYLEGAPLVMQDGLQIAGDADYGPLTDLGSRLEGADFNDYLGMRWTYPDGTIDRPRPELLHSLDCSGYMRLVWGYRAGLPLAHGPSDQALARRAVQMAASTFGVTIIAAGEPLEGRLDRLQPGDLLFFDADPEDGPAIDHVGMLLGPDEGGHLRFISSRKGPNGPTLGDAHGASLLDGTGLYARAFRAARRL